MADKSDPPPPIVIGDRVAAFRAPGRGDGTRWKTMGSCEVEAFAGCGGSLGGDAAVGSGIGVAGATRARRSGSDEGRGEGLRCLAGERGRGEMGGELVGEAGVRRRHC